MSCSTSWGASKIMTKYNGIMIKHNFQYNPTSPQIVATRHHCGICTKKNRPMRGNAMGWYYHHKWDGNGMGWDGSRNFVPITSYHPITITVICTTHQLPVGGMSALYQPINCQLVVCLHYINPSIASWWYVCIIPSHRLSHPTTRSCFPSHPQPTSRTFNHPTTYPYSATPIPPYSNHFPGYFQEGRPPTPHSICTFCLLLVHTCYDDWP